MDFDTNTLLLGLLFGSVGWAFLCSARRWAADPPRRRLLLMVVP